jgi:Asp-tRNA(Asn)/Glu-tRNA(Gln) amidotransferase A subunit family amidase
VHELDHLGPLARNSADLALVYDMAQGHDAGDAACADMPNVSTRQHLHEPVSGRIAVLDGWFNDLADEQGRDAVARVARTLRAAGTITLTGTARARAAAYVLTSASGGNLHLPMLKERAGDFDPATRDRLLAGALLPASAVMQAQRERARFREEVMEALRHNDLLIAPATPCSAPLLGQPTIRVGGRNLPTRANIGLLTQPLSFIGLPIVAVPIRNGPMPIAVQLIAAPWREDSALRAAAELELAGVARGPVELS